MGMPIVTLRGRTAVGRGGVSLMQNIGLADLVSEDLGSYVATAAKLADDQQRLVDLRGNMRQRMLASPLMDRTSFTRDFEDVCRQMWQAGNR
jgi:predicted O-linked N-acetylglucosamine transferase (SPINDLY family)